MKTRIPQLLSACLALVVLQASAETRYVNLNSPSPTSPYTNWLTAATNIQDAIDAAVAGDTVLVTNGVYATGGRAVYVHTNRVAITKAITLRSVNGPMFTAIRGYQIPSTTNGSSAIRCVYLTNGATLSGFTLTNGATRIGSANHFQEEAGGGVWCESTLATVTNCLMVRNAAQYLGGAAISGTLHDCVISNNSAGMASGSASSDVFSSLFIANKSGLSTLDGVIVYGSASYCTFISNSANFVATDAKMTNCLISRNSAGGAINSLLVNCTISTNLGVGVSQSGLSNCIVYYNGSQNYGNYCVFRFCCTTPLPAGTGNFTNAPSFVSLTGGDFHLQTNSPCINAGNNNVIRSQTDFNGDPRISGGTVDIGAYEFQSPASVLSYAWAQLNGLPTDGSADFTDADGDGANNWQEWRADTLPTNATSTLRMVTVTNGASGLVVSWASTNTRSYWLERATDLSAVPSFQTITNNLPGVVGTKTFNDTSATNGGPYFYRVGVQ